MRQDPSTFLTNNTGEEKGLWLCLINPTSNKSLTIFSISKTATNSVYKSSIYGVHCEEEEQVAARGTICNISSFFTGDLKNLVPSWMVRPVGCKPTNFTLELK